MASVHVGEVEPEAGVPLDVACADIQEAELQVAEASGDGRRRDAPRAVGIAVGKSERAIGVLAPEASRVAVAVPDDDVNRAGAAIGVADLDDPPGVVGRVRPGDGAADKLLDDGVALVAKVGRRDDAS